MSPEIPDRFVLFVRSLEPSTAAPAHEAIVQSLERLSEAGDVSFDLRVWGDALPLDPPCARTRTAEGLHAEVREIREWAIECGAVVPGFERVQTDTLVGSRREALSLPALLLAGYRGGDVVTVAPRIVAGHHYQVVDALAPGGDASGSLPGRERPIRH